jgi:dTDP-4-amino-4,6-dideoxygalactose transaminase
MRVPSGRGPGERSSPANLPPFEPDYAKPVYHLYVIRVPDRQALIRHLADSGIGAAIHYPVPLHLQKAYEWLGYEPGDFPVAEQVAPEIVSLPMFPQLTAECQARVVASVESLLSATHPVEAHAEVLYSRAVA